LIESFVSPIYSWFIYFSVAEDEHNCSLCRWVTPYGRRVDAALSDLRLKQANLQKEYQAALANISPSVESPKTVGTVAPNDHSLPSTPGSSNPADPSIPSSVDNTLMMIDPVVSAPASAAVGTDDDRDLSEFDISVESLLGDTDEDNELPDV